MAGKPVKKQELADLLKVNSLELEEAIKGVNAKYPGPILIRETSETVFMTVADKYLKSLWFLGKGELSAGELKTLAMVAYYSPVKQSDIIRTRGNRAYEQLDKLEELGLVNREPYSNTKLIKLSRKFFEYFGDEAVSRIRNSPVLKPGVD